MVAWSLAKPARVSVHVALGTLQASLAGPLRIPRLVSGHSDSIP